MPYSSAAPKPWAMARITELNPGHVLDVGPGAGTWGLNIRGRLGVSVHLDCIEAHGPYVGRFQLDTIYSNVFLGDVRSWDWGGMEYVTVAESAKPIGPGTPKWTWDLVILGDVLEHMTHDEARAVVDQALIHAPAVLVVVPLGEWPQGESEGNPLEAHVATWTTADLTALPKAGTGEIVQTPDGWIGAACLGAWP